MRVFDDSSKTLSTVRRFRFSMNSDGESMMESSPSRFRKQAQSGAQIDRSTSVGRSCARACSVSARGDVAAPNDTPIANRNVSRASILLIRAR